MGRFRANIHIDFGPDHAGAAQVVADAVNVPSLVTPPQRGWVTVYPEDTDITDDVLVCDLSLWLGMPCVSFYCPDPHFAVAALVIGGEVVDRIYVAPKARFEEKGMLDVSAADVVTDIKGVLTVIGNPHRWVDMLGVGSVEQFVSIGNDHHWCEYADQVSTAMLSTFDLGIYRMFMTHSNWNEHHPQLLTFLHT